MNRAKDDGQSLRRNPMFADQFGLRRLLVFHTLVSEGTMSKASERLYISQPAISAHIKALETALGVPLFNKTGRRLVVSSAGLVLYGKASRLLSMADELKTTMDNLRGTAIGRLTIGASIVWQYHLPQTLELFKSEYPQVELATHVASSDRIEKLVVDRSVDIGFIARPPMQAGLDFWHLANDQVVPVCRPGHPMAPPTRLELAKLDGRARFLIRESGSATRLVTDDILAALPGAASISMELGAQEAIEQVVMWGDEIGMVSRHGVGAKAGAGLLSIMDWPLLTGPLRLHAISLPRSTQPRIQTAFLEMVESNGAAIGDAEWKP